MKTTKCYCEDGPHYDKDNKFADGTGFVCDACQSNVYFIKKPKVANV